MNYSSMNFPVREWCLQKKGYRSVLVITETSGLDTGNVLDVHCVISKKGLKTLL